MDTVTCLQEKRPSSGGAGNFIYVRQLLGYGRFGDLDHKVLVDELYEKSWLPMRSHFSPVSYFLGSIRMEISSQHNRSWGVGMVGCAGVAL